MTTRIAFIDLDGVVADNTTRFAKAEEAKRNAHKLVLTTSEATNLYWQTAFTPELVALDTLIPGVNDALLTLDELDYRVIFLTSRPESMRDATLEWLVSHTVYGTQHNLIMKAPAFQYTKTVTWKAGMVQTLAALYGADDIVFIDDELANCQEVMKYQPIPLVFQSLAEAIEKL